MAEYGGCSDGNCILRNEPLRVHTNGGCRCLRDIPTQLRIAIHRRIRGQQAEIERLRAENERLREDIREWQLWNKDRLNF
jgi:hypothetical protein